MPENEKKKPEVDPARVLRAAYPSNSNKAKAEAPKVEKKIEKLEGIAAVKQKPALGKRIREAFTGDGARGIGDFLLFEVALPAIKTTLFDLINQGANRALFGSGGQPGSASRRPGVVDYNRISRNQVHNQSQAVVMSPRDKATHNFEGVVLPTRQDAETVLTRLIDLVDQYDFVAVADLYEMLSITGSFTDDRWGWFNLSGADIVPVRGGFALELPPVQPLQ